MANERSISVPVNIDDPIVLRRVLLSLLEEQAKLKQRIKELEDAS